MSWTLAFENTLTGPVGQVPTDNSLTASGDPMTVTTPGHSEYSDTYTLHNLNTIQIKTGKHRQETPRLSVSGFNDLPFSIRWYCWFPQIPTGNGERRWIARFGDVGLIAHQTSYGNLYLQMSPADIAADEISPTASGVAQPVGQWLRIEAQYTTTNNPVFRVFSEHQEDEYREFSFAGADLSGGDVQLTGYRYRRRTLIQWGSSGQAVTELQEELIAIGYLPSGSADGVYGDQLYNAIMAFQTDHGLTADGAAGNETRAAIDVVRGGAYPPLYMSHLAFADGTWIGPEPAPIPPLPEPNPYPISIGLTA
ncbi:peptidoglycan-binding domain-containing protein [Nocardiopsis sp. NPDC049922]|uniref:peptidoglycan-binding domain-containing protein n=1 Tax=Nocardiopsis sp. NPDC049922 TaxID=3155157 RepID=UPI0033E3C379